MQFYERGLNSIKISLQTKIINQRQHNYLYDNDIGLQYNGPLIPSSLTQKSKQSSITPA